MNKKIGTFEKYEQTIKQLGGNGLLLVSGEQGNPMTIGWGTIGIIWGIPVFTVLVRPSRYTFNLIEDTNQFTVNVPGGELAKQVSICGTESGRDVDKIKKCGFTLKKSKHINIPYIEECKLHYECRVVHKNLVQENKLDRNIIGAYYPGGDFHTVYFGEIFGVYLRE